MPAAGPLKTSGVPLDSAALKVAIVPDHCAELLTVPPDNAGALAATIRSKAYTKAFLLAMPLEATFVTETNEFRIALKVSALLSKPMPPTQTSLVWVVVGVEPVLALILLPEAPAKTSAGLVAAKPLYSITAAAA